MLSIRTKFLIYFRGDVTYKIVLRLKVLAYNFDGIRYDIGNKIGLLKANIEFGLRNPETSEDLKEYLKSIKM